MPFQNVRVILLEIFQSILFDMKGKRYALSPTAMQCFNIWLEQAVKDVIDEDHIHHAPQELAIARKVSVSRVKYNLSKIYTAFNVCCEPELYMLVRIAYIALKLGNNRVQISQIIRSHIKGLS